MNYSDKQHLDDEKKRGKKKDKAIAREISEYEKSLLLNFQYEYTYQPQEQYRSQRPKTLSVREKKRLKQNYLQGNFKFFVSPDFDLDIKYIDPNQEIKWEKLIQLIYITTNMINCPICLNDHYDLKLPKITKCGHIFCWPCIVKHLSFQKPKCPLCDEIVLLDDLRTVIIVHFPVIGVGENVKFKFKKRRKTENIVYNAEDFTEEEEFMRIQKIYYEGIKEIKEGEKKALYDYLRDLQNENDEETKPFAEKCLIMTNQALEALEEKAFEWAPKPRKASKEASFNATHSHEEDFFFFYQEASGLNIFLHPIDNKFMKTEYQYFKSFPLTLEAPLLEMDSFQHSDQTRKRYRFLDHIPLNSDIKFAQVEMRFYLSTMNYQTLNQELDKHKEIVKAREIKEAPPKQHRKESFNTHANKQSDYSASLSYPQIELNPEPTTLKLDDKQAYPELGGQTEQGQANEAQGSWWEKEVRPIHKDKNQGMKPTKKEEKKTTSTNKKGDPDSYVVAEDSNQVSLGDFITFATVKKSKKKR